MNHQPGVRERAAQLGAVLLEPAVQRLAAIAVGAVQLAAELEPARHRLDPAAEPLRAGELPPGT